MSLFGPPKCYELYERKNIKGLLKALEYKKDEAIPREAAKLLERLSSDFHDMALRKMVLEALMSAFPDQNTSESLKAIYSIFDESLDLPFRHQVAVYFLSRVQGDFYLDEAITGVGVAASEFIDTDLYEPIKKGIYKTIDGPSRKASLECLIACLKKTHNDNFKQEIANTFEPLVKSGNYSDRMLVAQAYSLLGPVAIPQILKNLDGNFFSIQKILIDALCEWGWKPSADAIGAIYGIVKSDWKTVQKIGVPSICPLVDYLERVSERYREQKDAYITLRTLSAKVEDPDLQKRITDLMLATIKLPDPEFSNTVEFRGQTIDFMGQTIDFTGQTVDLDEYSALVKKTGLKELIDHVEKLRKGAVEKHQIEKLAATEVKSIALNTLEGIGPPSAESLFEYFELGIRHGLYYQVAESLAGIKDKHSTQMLGIIVNKSQEIAVVDRVIEALTDHEDDDAVILLIEIIRRLSRRSLPDAVGYLLEKAVKGIKHFGKRAGPHLSNAFLLHATEPGFQEILADLLRDVGGWEEAVESLVKILKEKKNLEEVENACTFLGKLHWEPTRSNAGALYYAVQGEWEKCQEMGEHAIPALLFILKAGQKRYDRRPEKAAEALKAMYETGMLSDETKKRLLAFQGTAYAAHNDSICVNDNDCEFHTDHLTQKFQL